MGIPARLRGVAAAAGSAARGAPGPGNSKFLRFSALGPRVAGLGFRGPEVWGLGLQA